MKQWGKKAKLFAIELAPGEYYVNRWRVSSGYATINPTTPISIKFKIEPGKATYMGHFNFIQTDSLGLTITGITVEYFDNFKEDSKVLQTKYPHINLADIVSGIEPNMSIKGLGGSSQSSWDIPIII